GVSRPGRSKIVDPRATVEVILNDGLQEKRFPHQSEPHHHTTRRIVMVTKSQLNCVQFLGVITGTGFI
ncbi:MAG: hypothetical protein WAO55_10265, partial [Candidatus Manganitrophaceae bacterium]